MIRGRMFALNLNLQFGVQPATTPEDADTGHPIGFQPNPPEETE